MVSSVVLPDMSSIFIDKLFWPSPDDRINVKEVVSIGYSCHDPSSFTYSLLRPDKASEIPIFRLISLSYTVVPSCTEKVFIIGFTRSRKPRSGRGRFVHRW